MSRMVLSSSTPAVVSQRLCQLLLSCPSAASGGVPWKTLVCMYEEQYSLPLDVKRFGNSAVTAATTLLWSILRLVNAEDVDNPLVAVEDAEALVPKPGSLTSWPSMYKVLHEVVLRYGTLQAADEGADKTSSESHAILLSQLKPLLQRHWHGDFNECESYFAEDGSSKKPQTMTHLVHALLTWREQRAAWSEKAGIKHSQVDEALRPQLELFYSSDYNDWVLRCMPETETARPPAPCLVDGMQQETCPGAAGELHDDDAVLHSISTILESETIKGADDLFELKLWTADSTVEPSSFASSSGCTTPTSSCAAFAVAAAASGSTTPCQLVTHSLSVPAFPMGDREVIPCGVVQQRRKTFER